MQSYETQNRKEGTLNLYGQTWCDFIRFWNINLQI